MKYIRGLQSLTKDDKGCVASIGNFDGLHLGHRKIISKLKQKSESLKEFNPMLGHRGCRLGITYEEIYDMQVRAIFEASLAVRKEGLSVTPEII